MYWSRECIQQSDWFKLFLPRSQAVYMTHMHEFFQTLSPRFSEWGLVRDTAFDQCGKVDW